MKSYLFTFKGWVSGLALMSAMGVGLGLASAGMASDGGSLTLAPTQAELTAGSQLQVTAVVRDATGAVVSQPNLVYSVEPTSLGTIDQQGLFSARRVGQGTIIALSGDHRATVAVSVPFHAEARNIELWPVDRKLISDEYTITTDETVLLEALAIDHFGNEWDATSEVVFSTNNPEGGFVESTFNPGNLGSFELRASLGDLSDTNLITIERGALYRVTVDVKDVKITADHRVELGATGYDADNHSWDLTDEATFETTDPKGAIQGQTYFPGAAGVWNVIAVMGQTTGSTEMTVKAGKIQAIKLLPKNQDIRPGGSIRYKLFANDADLNTWDVTPSTTFESEAGLFFGNRLDVGKEIGTMDVIAQYHDLIETTTVDVTSTSTQTNVKVENPTGISSLDAFAAVEPQTPVAPVVPEAETTEQQPAELASGVVEGASTLEETDEQGEVLGVEDEAVEEEVTGPSLDTPVTSEDEEVVNEENAAAPTTTLPQKVETEEKGSSTGAWITIGIILALGLIGVGVIGLTQRRA